MAMGRMMNKVKPWKRMKDREEGEEGGDENANVARNGRAFVSKLGLQTLQTALIRPSPSANADGNDASWVYGRATRGGQSRGRRPRSPTAHSEGRRLRVDTNSPLPLLTSLTHLNHLTPTLPRIRETLKQDGRLERLVRLLRSFYFAPTTRKPNRYLQPLPALCLPTTACTCSQPKEL